MELGGGGAAPEPLLSRPGVEQEGLGLLQETVGSVFADYGWYIIFVCIAVYFIVEKLSGRISRWRSSASAVIEDSVVVVRQHEAVASARLRMQEELNAQAEKFKERQKQLDEEKRRQKIEMWESMKEGKSYKASPRQSQADAVPSTSMSSTVQKPKSEKKSIRDNSYNPLTGAGGGTCAWRPGRRGPSSGGG